MNRPSRMTSTPILPRALAGLVVLAPAGMLAMLASGSEGLPRSVYLGVAVTLAIEALFVLNHLGAFRALSSFYLVAFYTASAIVIRFNAPHWDYAATHLCFAAGILVPMVLIIRREVVSASGNARLARFLIRQLLSRKDWPTTFADYREDPLICRLRDALREGAAPVMPLLANEDVRLQVAALTALEYQPVWRSVQVDVVIQRAGISDQPAVRAAAMMALPNVTRTRHLRAMIPFLRDFDPEVRRCTFIALLWDARNRWNDVRADIRQALGFPLAARDGPLPLSGHLPPAALQDLLAWSVESGPVGRRSTQTVIRHCQKTIQEDGTPEAIERVSQYVADAKVPPAIRVEIAHCLQAADSFPPEVAARLLGYHQPTMLRVLAAGTLLGQGENPEAVEVLREAGRQPNREITLAAARLVQRYLGVDMGLPVGGTLPATNSREAAEIARRVMRWATDPGSQAGIDTPKDALVPASDIAYF